MEVDPRTPVVVGVGQFTERIDDAGYRGMSSVDLATEAVRAALADTGADVSTVAEAIEVFAGLRQFEICTPFTKPPLGCSDNYVRSVANRVGADPARAVLEPIGGNGPQKLMTEFAGAIAAGDIEVALILGSEPGSTAKYFAGRDDKPDFTEHVGGQLEDRGYGFEQYMSEYTAKHGLTGAPVQYGLLDNARRGTARTQRRRLPARDGRALRPVHRSRCKEPVLVLAGGTVGGGDRNRHRREPDDLRPVSAAAGGARHRQSRRRRSGDVGVGGPPARGARGQVGLSARACRSDRAGLAGPRRRQYQLLRQTGRGRGAPGSRTSASTT